MNVAFMDNLAHAKAKKSLRVVGNESGKKAVGNFLANYRNDNTTVLDVRIFRIFMKLLLLLKITRINAGFFGFLVFCLFFVFCLFLVLGFCSCWLALPVLLQRPPHERTTYNIVASKWALFVRCGGEQAVSIG